MIFHKYHLLLLLYIFIVLFVIHTSSIHLCFHFHSFHLPLVTYSNLTYCSNNLRSPSFDLINYKIRFVSFYDVNGFTSEYGKQVIENSKNYGISNQYHDYIRQTKLKQLKKRDELKYKK